MSDMTLNEVSIGKTVCVIKIEGNGAVRRRLLDMGLTPRTLVNVRKIAPMGDPIELYLRGFVLTIRQKEAAMIEVEDLR